jgi:uncharacterized protein
MKLAILSDIHDHIWNLHAALDACRDAEAMICCGDLCSPFIVNLLADGFPGPIHIVFGNNDGDQLRIARNAARYEGRVRLHGEFAILPPEECGIRIAVNHYPAIAEGLAASGEYDLVCYGHDHRIRVDGPLSLLNRIAQLPRRTSIINPGAIMGYDPAANATIPATFVRLVTESMTGEIYEIRGGSAVRARSLAAPASET